MINSLSFVIFNLFFNYEVSYISQMVNVVFTSLLYFIFSFLFNFIEGNFNVR
jgi:hypothetical protein